MDLLESFKKRTKHRDQQDATRAQADAQTALQTTREQDVLAACMSATIEKLTVANRRFRSLHSTQKQLLQRNRALDALQQRPVGHTGHAAAAEDGVQGEKGPDRYVSDASSTPDTKLSLVADTKQSLISDISRQKRRPGEDHASWEIADDKRLHVSSIWRQVEADAVRDTPPTAPRAPVSYTLILPYAPVDSKESAATGGYDHRWVDAALAAYMHDTAAEKQCRLQDVHWVPQLPYTLPDGECVSCAGPSVDFGSGLSLVLAHTACVVESFILEAEQEVLGPPEAVSASPHSSSGQSLLEMLRSDANEPQTPLDKCAARDDVLLQLLHLHAGADGACTMDAGVKCVVHGMLRRQRHVLPVRIWKAACVRVVRWLQASVEGMQKRMPDAEVSLAQQLLDMQGQGGSQALGVEASSQERGLPMTSISAAQLVMFQGILHEVLLELQEASNTSHSHRGVQKQCGTLREVRLRMLEHFTFFEWIQHCSYINAPRMTLQLLVRAHVPSYNSKGERLAVKVIRSLCLSATQRTELAQQWRTWRRRCRALHSKLSAAASHLHDILPRVEDLQLVLRAATLIHPSKDESNSAPMETLQSLARFAADTAPPVATVATGAPQRAPSLPIPSRQANPSSVQKPAQHSSLEGMEGTVQYSGLEDSFQVMCGMYDNVSTVQGLDPETCIQTSPHQENASAPCGALETTPPRAKQGGGGEAGGGKLGGGEPDNDQQLRKRDRNKSNALLLRYVEAASTKSVVSGARATAANAHEKVGSRCTLQQGSLVKLPQPGSPTASHASALSQHGHGVATLRSALMHSCDSAATHAILGETQHAQHALEVSATRAEGFKDSRQGEEGTRTLLGESGVDMHYAERAVSELLACRHSMLLLIMQNTRWTFGASPAQQARIANATMMGSPKFDFLKLKEVAAHEERWQNVFTPMRLFEDTDTVVYNLDPTDVLQQES